MRTIRNIILGLLLCASGMGDAAEGAEGGAAQLGAILDYVVSDYPTAVSATGVLNPQELKEQQGFLAEAIELTGGLAKEEREALLGRLQQAKDAAALAAPPSGVVPLVASAVEELHKHHAIRRSPHSGPVMARGKSLYESGCTSCHSVDGSGRADEGIVLSTRPPNLRDRAQSGPMSPYRIFNAISYGVPGTAMPSYQQCWGAEERWDVAFYSMSLAHGEAREDSSARSVSLPHLASTTDDELRSELRLSGSTDSDIERILGDWRSFAPYRAPSIETLAPARKAAANAAQLYASGEPAAARTAALSAYLDEFEPHEAALSVTHSALVAELEESFTELRTSIEGGRAVSDVQAVAARLQALLDKAGDVQGVASSSVSFMAALAIALREGLEATLLLAALLAVASRAKGGQAKLAVHVGWVAAAIAGVATWWLSGELLSHSGASRELMEGAVQLVTAVLLLFGSHWLLARASAKRWMEFLSRRLKTVGAIGLGGLAFASVFREAFEVVVFYRGLLYGAPGRSRVVATGAILGVVALAIIVGVFQRLGRRLQPRPLLLACGVLLCALAVAMVGEGVRCLQEGGILGLHAVSFPQHPAIGLFATVEGLASQGVVLAMLLASLAYSAARRRSAGEAI